MKKNVGIFTEIFLYKEGLKENCISQYSANLLIFLHSKTSRKLFYHLIVPKSHTTSQLLQFLFLLKLLFLSLHSFSLFRISPLLSGYCFTKKININMLSNFCLLISTYLEREAAKWKTLSFTEWQEGLGGKRINCNDSLPFSLLMALALHYTLRLVPYFNFGPDDIFYKHLLPLQSVKTERWMPTEIPSQFLQFSLLIKRRAHQPCLCCFFILYQVVMVKHGLIDVFYFSPG